MQCFNVLLFILTCYCLRDRCT